MPILVLRALENGDAWFAYWFKEKFTSLSNLILSFIESSKDFNLGIEI